VKDDVKNAKDGGGTIKKTRKEQKHVYFTEWQTMHEGGGCEQQSKGMKKLVGSRFREGAALGERKSLGEAKKPSIQSCSVEGKRRFQKKNENDEIKRQKRRGWAGPPSPKGRDRPFWKNGATMKTLNDWKKKGKGGTGRSKKVLPIVCRAKKRGGGPFKASAGGPSPEGKTNIGGELEVGITRG